MTEEHNLIDKALLDEQEYNRLMSLDWIYGRYGDPIQDETTPEHRMNFGAYAAQDGDYLVIRWYSAQPAPDFDHLPREVKTVNYRMFLFPHYTCFRWLSNASSALLMEKTD